MPEKGVSQHITEIWLKGVQQIGCDSEFLILLSTMGESSRSLIFALLDLKLIDLSQFLQIYAHSQELRAQQL